VRALLLLLFTACGRLSFDAERDPPAHLSEAPAPATARLEVGAGTLDTTGLTLDGLPVPEGTTFLAAAQPGGPEVAVLAVQKLRVEVGGTLLVIGSRPLVVVAEVILIEGVLDAGAHGSVPGPGGALPGDGPGVGASPTKPDPGDVCDPAGGGGGFGQAGATGGVDSCTVTGGGGAGGASYGDDELAILIGGSGGGTGSPGECATTLPGGAGGGALQLTAYEHIEITATGVISVGGGGGSGGVFCGLNDAGAGSGGGSGGALFLEAPEIDVANPTAFGLGGGGGGGGGNGNSGNGVVGIGEAGDDGGASGGRGGATGAVTTSGDGGSGGAPGSEPTIGEPADFNPGGGGGGAGRFVQRTP
jgi:hypothetical protein